MGNRMTKDWENYHTECLSDNIVSHLLGDKYPFYMHENSSIIKPNSKNLSVNGELYFLWSFNAWKNLTDCNENCASILQHFARMHDTTEIDENTDINETVLKWLIIVSKEWPLQIHKYILQKERVCLFLNRRDVLAKVLSTVSFRSPFSVKSVFSVKPSPHKFPYPKFHLKFCGNGQSNLSIERLRMMRNFAVKMLDYRSYHCCIDVTEEDDDDPWKKLLGCNGSCDKTKYVFISGSVGLLDKEYKDYKKYVCGLVKNPPSNWKGRYGMNLTWEEYVHYRELQLAKLNKCKFSESSEEVSDIDMRKLVIERHRISSDVARANATFELLGVKPSRTVVIRNNTDDTNVTNAKGGSFVLYNTARIAAIIKKYNERVSRGDYPRLPNSEIVDFSQLCEEEEWELVYNFIFRYRNMKDACLTFEPNIEIHPQLLCSFLLRLSQKFSAYYRKTRILLKGDHLIPKTVARIYMLHALQNVFYDALSYLNLYPLSRM